MQDLWDVIAEESLDASLDPVGEVVHQADLQPEGASITWSGDGKYFATVCSSR